MLAMYTRRLNLPKRSFFLFGPRGTGKTTWLRQVLPEALWFDLLRTQTFLELSQHPELFRQRVAAAPKGAWIVVDEVQRAPFLLNEVHALLAEHGARYRFALSGSSARRLKRLDANLLAGRAINRRCFALTAAELGFEYAVDDILSHGLLPQVRVDADDAVDTLDAYVENYVREEIQQEALVKRLDSFARFLRVAALINGQAVNVAGVARDAAVARPTVQGYFDILVDTLLGFWLPAWRQRAKVKEVASPKFYLFDTGVARALAGRTREPIEAAERGVLLETWILHELRAAIEYGSLGGDLHYWRTPSGSEVDFVWSRGRRTVGIEVKSSSRWRQEDGRALKDLVTRNIILTAIGVYGGTHELRDGQVRVLPIGTFLRELSAGNILA
jgi:predicted AAA+ superfamily ATPase